MITRPKAFAQELWADTSGIILPYVTVMLVVIIGVSVLAVDGARMTSLQTQLQKGADAFALAAARELGGDPNAITRANAVLANPVNTTLPGMGNANVTVSSHRFLRSLPALDTEAITGANETTDPALARYVEVTVSPVTLPTILPAGFFGGATSVTAGASAVAGTEQVVCDMTPMYICNPFEQAGDDYDAATERLQDAMADSATKRRLVSLRNDPGSSQLPGNYGFLAAPQTNGFNAVRDSIAKIHAPACFRQRGVDFQTGFAGNSIASAFNVRLDVYDASMNSHKTDADYAPATNVRKGYWLSSGSNWCNATMATGADASKVMALPNDANMRVDGPLGDGNWDFQAYWDKNHQSLIGQYPNGWSNANLPSRYEVYQYEISRGTNPGGLSDASFPSASPPTPRPQEIGAPRCNTNAPPANIDRRLLYVAVINCGALGLGGGTQSDVPVAAFGKAFFTRPVDGSTGEILAEIVNLVGPGSGDSEHNDTEVQLYR